MMSSVSPSSQCGLRVQVRRRVRADLAAHRLVTRQQLAPRPDGDVRLLAADRDIGVGGVGDAQQQVLELLLARRELRVDGGDPLAGA